MHTHQAEVILADEPARYTTQIDHTVEFVRLDLDTVGIDQVRQLILEAHRRPQEGYERKQIVITGRTITSEAQQAALKILEEPPQTSSITLVLPTGTQLLATVVSRVNVVVAPERATSNVFLGWLRLSYSERLAEVEQRSKAKDMLWIQALKTDLLSYCTTHPDAIGSERETLLLVAENLQTRGASDKMLLEHLALSLPLTT
jgi:hypothetical protein